MGREARGADLLDWGVSMTRMTCAVSLAVASQAMRALSGRPRRAQRELDAIRHTAREGLTGPAYGLFRLGEQVERGMVEATSRLARDAGEALDPPRVAARARELFRRAFTRRRARQGHVPRHADDARRSWDGDD